MCLPHLPALAYLVIGLNETVVVIMMNVESDSLNVGIVIFFPEYNLSTHAVHLLQPHPTYV